MPSSGCSTSVQKLRASSWRDVARSDVSLTGTISTRRVMEPSKSSALVCARVKLSIACVTRASSERDSSPRITLAPNRIQSLSRVASSTKPSSYIHRNIRAVIGPIA